jgi:hypothetical protein
MKTEDSNATSFAPVATNLPQFLLLKNNLFDASLSQFELKSLAPGAVFRVPVLIRGSDTGVIEIKFVFGFRGTSETKNLYHTFRLSKSIEFVPALRVSTFTKTSAQKVDQFLVGLEVHLSLDSSLD